MNKDIIKKKLAGVVGDNRLTALALTRIVGEKPVHETAPAVRRIIRDLIAEGTPIGSDNYGYYMITEREEFEDVLEGLQARCDAIQERIADITTAYTALRSSRHHDTNIDIKDRCRFYVIHIAESANIPYQAVWTMAYRKLQKLTGVNLVVLPDWYNGSVLNYVVNQGLVLSLYKVLYELEGVLL